MVRNVLFRKEINSRDFVEGLAMGMGVHDADIVASERGYVIYNSRFSSMPERLFSVDVFEYMTCKWNRKYRSVYRPHMQIRDGTLKVRNGVINGVKSVLNRPN